MAGFSAIIAESSKERLTVEEFFFLMLEFTDEDCLMQYISSRQWVMRRRAGFDLLKECLVLSLDLSSFILILSLKWCDSCWLSGNTICDLMARQCD